MLNIERVMQALRQRYSHLADIQLEYMEGTNLAQQARRVQRRVECHIYTATCTAAAELLAGHGEGAAWRSRHVVRALTSAEHEWQGVGEAQQGRRAASLAARHAWPAAAALEKQHALPSLTLVIL